MNLRKAFFNRPILYLVLLNLALKMIMFLYIEPWNKNVETNKIVISDSQGYEGVAENLVKFNSFVTPGRHVDVKSFSEYQSTCLVCAYPDILWMPGYPVFLSIVYRFTGINPFAGIFVQIFVSLLSVVMIYKICMMFFNKQSIAVLASVLFSLDIHSIYIANLLLPDTIFVTFFLIAVYYFFKGALESRPLFIGLSSLFLGIACLIKPIVMLYPAILIFLLFFFFKQTWLWKIKWTLVYGLIYLAIIGTWSYRNHSLYGHWSLSLQGGDSFVMYNVSMTEAKISHANVDSIRVHFQEKADSLGFKEEHDPFKQELIYRKIGMTYIMNHKGAYFVSHLEGATNIFLSLGNIGMAKTFGWTDQNISKNMAEISFKRILLNFSSNKKEALLGIMIFILLMIEYIGLFYGTIQLVRWHHFSFLLLCLLTIVYWAGLIGVIGMYRYRIPLIPFICIVAAYGYYYIVSGRKLPTDRS